MQFYRIKDWQNIYENNRSRELKNLRWVYLPINLSGDGYSQIMEDKKNGPSIFGAFIAVIELAAQCCPRGDLIKSSGEPHDFSSIGRICRINSSLIESTISFCINPLNWIEIIGLNTNCGDLSKECEKGATLLSSPVLSYPLHSLPFQKAKFGKRSIIFEPPTQEEVTKYFIENGFSEALSKRFFDGYAAADWHDSKGKKIKIWKQKAQQVWFKPEEKINSKARFGRQDIPVNELKEQAARLMEKHQHEL
jgi:hypothetical protein